MLRRGEWDSARRAWFTNGNESAYKAMSFNMCLRHMGFRPTRGTRYATFFFFFITLGLELRDTNVYEP